MERRLTVTRIFPLGQYKNIQLTNEIILNKEEFETWGNDTESIYDGLIHEIYVAYFNHRRAAEAFEAGGTLEEKWHAYVLAREE